MKYKTIRLYVANEMANTWIMENDVVGWVALSPRVVVDCFSIIPRIMGRSGGEMGGYAGSSYLTPGECVAVLSEHRVRVKVGENWFTIAEEGFKNGI